MATRRSAKKATYKVNFKGVEAGGGGRLLPEDTYLFEIEDVEVKTGEDSGEPYFAFTLKVAEGEFEGTKAWDNFSLQPQALWKLRGLMETLEMEVIDGEMDLDPDEFAGMMVKGDVIHEDWKGKPKHRVNSYMAADAEAATVETKEAVSKGPKKKAAAPEPDPEPEWAKNQKVSFKDGKKTLSGKVISVTGQSVTVRVGSDEYEVESGDLEAA